MSFIENVKNRQRPRKWSQVYCEKIAENREQHTALEKYKNETVLKLWSRTVISKRYAVKLHQKRRSIASHTREPKLKGLTFEPWMPHWGTQNLCCVCERPCFNDCVVCKCCNSIAHGNCAEINKTSNGEGHRRHSFDPYKDNDKVDYNEFICGECRDLQSEEKYRYVQQLYTIKEGRAKEVQGKFIAKRLLAYIFRIRFKRQRRFAVLIQSVTRGYLCRKRFQSCRKSQMRVVVVSIRDLPELPDGAGIVLTVVDTMKHTQLFRLDKSAERNNEECKVTMLSSCSLLSIYTHRVTGN